MFKNGSFYIDTLSRYEEVCGEIELYFRSLYRCPKEQIKVIFVIMEAINNAIEHGGFPVDVNVELSNTTASITIKDNGAGFPVPNKMKLIQENGVETLLNERRYFSRGRGIYLMYLTAKEVRFNEIGNEVKLLLGRDAS